MSTVRSVPAGQGRLASSSVSPTGPGRVGPVGTSTGEWNEPLPARPVPPATYA